MTIENNGGGTGYLLVFAAREDPDLGSDYWFADLVDAEAAAKDWFGIGPERWQDA